MSSVSGIVIWSAGKLRCGLLQFVECSVASVCMCLLCKFTSRIRSPDCCYTASTLVTHMVAVDSVCLGLYLWKAGLRACPPPP